MKTVRTACEQETKNVRVFCEQKVDREVEKPEERSPQFTDRKQKLLREEKSPHTFQAHFE